MAIKNNIKGNGTTFEERSKDEQYWQLNEEWPTMTFIEAVKECFRKYAMFTGRSRRSEFWWFLLFFVLLSSVTCGFGVMN